jgi:hypothetical protein
LDCYDCSKQLGTISPVTQHHITEDLNLWAAPLWKLQFLQGTSITLKHHNCHCDTHVRAYTRTHMRAHAHVSRNDFLKLHCNNFLWNKCWSFHWVFMQLWSMYCSFEKLSLSVLVPCVFVPIEIALSICGCLIGWLSDWFFYCLIRVPCVFVHSEIALSMCGYLIGWLSDWFFYCLIKFFSPAEIILY